MERKLICSLHTIFSVHENIWNFNKAIFQSLKLYDRHCLSTRDLDSLSKLKKNHTCGIVAIHMHAKSNFHGSNPRRTYFMFILKKIILLILEKKWWANGFSANVYETIYETVYGGQTVFLALSYRKKRVVFKVNNWFKKSFESFDNPGWRPYKRTTYEKSISSIGPGKNDCCTILIEKNCMTIILGYFLKTKIFWLKTLTKQSDVLLVKREQIWHQKIVRKMLML